MDLLEVGEHSAHALRTLPGLIDAVGGQDFGGRLLDCLHSSCGIEYCTVYNLSSKIPTAITTGRLQGVADLARQQTAIYFEDDCWRKDPMVALASVELDARNVSAVRMQIDDMPFDFTDLLFRRTGVCDRVVLCSRGEFGMVMVSMLRTVRCGAFSQGELSALRSIDQLIMSAIKKHVEIRLRSQDMMLAFTSLDAIERNLAAAAKEIPLSRREAEVCARIIYGMSTVGISLDLGIGEETVVTYRKRAYQRLNVAIQRDLYLWYLSLWNPSYLSRETYN